MTRLRIVPAFLLFLAMLPTTMAVSLQKEIVQNRFGASPMEMALFLSLTTLGLFVFSPLAGYLSDKYSIQKALISIFAFVNAACFAAIAFAPNTFVLLLARFIEGGSLAFIIGPLLAFVSGDGKGPWSGIAGMVIALGAALGIPLGGALGQGSWISAMLWACAFMVCAGMISGLTPRKVLEGESAPKNKERLTFQKAVQLISANPILLLPFAFAFVDRFIAGFLVGPFSWRLRNELGMEPIQVGKMLAATMLPMILFAVPASILARRTGATLLIVLGSIMYGSFVALSGFVEAERLLPTMILAGIGAGLLYSPSIVLTAKLASPELRTTAMSLYLGIGSLGFMFGPGANQIRSIGIFESYAALSLAIGFFAILPAIVAVFLLGRLRTLEQTESPVANGFTADAPARHTL